MESSLIFFPPGGAIPEFISLQSQAETKKFPLVLHKIYTSEGKKNAYGQKIKLVSLFRKNFSLYIVF